MNLALFDFDGTITTSETFAGFMHAVVPARRLAVGKVVLAPLVLGYRLGLVSGTTVRAAVVKFGLRGLAEEQLRQAGRVFAEQVLPGIIRAEAWERIAWHKAQGDTVVVVSGAFDAYLSPWCEQHQLELVCSRLDVAGGVLTGRYRGAQCVDREKPRRVAEAYPLAGFPLVYAYGDTREDLAMLAIAGWKYYRWKEIA